MPDFLQSLLEYHPITPTQISTLPQSPRPKSELRYAAYAPPKVGPRLTRRPSSSQASVSNSFPSHPGSPSITAGQLALTSGLESIHIGIDSGPVIHPEVPTLIDLQVGEFLNVEGLRLLRKGVNFPLRSTVVAGGSHLA